MQAAVHDLDYGAGRRGQVVPGPPTTLVSMFSTGRPADPACWTGLAEAAPDAYAQIAADVTVRIGRLYSTAYTAAEVANGLGVNGSRVRQHRLNRTLWAIGKICRMHLA
jgi:hypothetical protein